MSRCLVAVVVGCMLLLASCCSTGSSPTLSGSRSAKAAFSLKAEQGSSFEPRLIIKELGESTEVELWADEAAELTEAFLHLSYDASRFSPKSVVIGEFLGSPDQVLSLGLTDILAEVPIGICQINSNPVEGNGLLATVTFANEPAGLTRNVSKAPSGTPNQVTNLIATPEGAGSAALSWTEKNIGDYDNNSEVGITDLQPLANFIFQKVDQTSDPVWAGLMDGDGNGEINSADIVPIASNFGTTIKGYQVYTDSAGTTPADGGNPCLAERPTSVDPKVPVEYDVVVPFVDGTTPTFTVRPVANDGSFTTGELSNPAEMVIITDPPEAPSNLLALAAPEYGEGVIHLEWDAPDSPHLSKYEVQRKLSSEDETAWAKIIDVNPSSLLYNDSGLADESYDYRVYAWNAGDFISENPSNVATNSPYFAPFPDPPTNLTAAAGAFDSSIALNWNWAVPQEVGDHFNIYRKAPNDPDFSLIDSTINSTTTTYTDQGLNEGETYEYYVTFARGVQETGPSNTASAEPKPSEAINITDLTTDKTTHAADGSDGQDSTLEVTCDRTPTSVDWVCSLGSVTGTGTTVTWSPPGGATPQVVTITCTVHKGSNVDSRDIKLYLTEENIKTEKGQSGMYVSFNNLPCNLQRNTPYKPLSDFIDERKVVLFNKFGVW